MRTTTLLALALSACDADGALGDHDSQSPTESRADVAGTLDRVDEDGVDWVGFEVVDLTTSSGECGLTREIVAVEAEAPCDGCGLTLSDIATTVVDEFGECGVDLERAVPTVGSSLAFRAGARWQLPARGEVLVEAGEAWVPYSSGLLEAGELSYQHQTRLGGSNGHGGDVRDLPDKPVTR